MVRCQVLSLLRRWHSLAVLMRAQAGVVARGRRRAAAMLLAGHFSVWAVTASAAAIEERERERARFDAVAPFVVAKKASCAIRVYV